MKCLPASKVSLANGAVLHDWHAEILAIRAFNSFLIQECAQLASTGLKASTYVRRHESHELSQSQCQPFTVKEDVSIHMYCSEAPCGDASMELTINAQDDATPWEVSSPTTDKDGLDNGSDVLLRGRGYFSELGIVRRKPSRPDAPATLSKSCSDKIALKQCTSLLSSLASLLISPRKTYISTLVLPKSQHIPGATDRAFSASGRMSSIDSEMTSRWQGGYGYRPFRVQTTAQEFAWSRRSATSGQKLIPSNLSAVYTPQWQETLIGGTLQGRKQFDPRGASKICRRSMWVAVADVAVLLAIPAIVEAARRSKYAEVKNDNILKDRGIVKAEVKATSLKGWVNNVGDDTFSLLGDA